MTKFRSRVWDPALIISQIASMQFQFYSSLLIVNYLINRFVNATVASDSISYSLAQVFDHRLVNFQTASNGSFCVSFLINSVVSALFQWRLVNRSKQCLDFTVTVIFYHFLFSSIYTGSFPSTFMFWFIMIICGIVQTLLSEYLSMKTALAEIPLLSSKAFI